jgi:pimeloyl-ACP methyl ester carboxylesterase
MMIRDLFRLAQLLMRLLRRASPRIGAGPYHGTGPQGICFDCYQPRAGVRNTIIALHGCTLNGKDDPRLQHLGRCLAASGSRCVIPTLPGLSRFQWEPSDIDALVDFMLQLPGGENSIGLMGFSYGGSYALLAAARPRVAARIKFVFSFGAYYALDDLSRDQSAFARSMPQRADDQDSWIYVQLVLAWRHAARIGLPDDIYARLTDLLKRYCHASTPAEKHAFYQRHLSHVRLGDLERAPLDDMRRQQLSPAGRLGGLECQVKLFHDAGDPLVPAAHARSIARELAGAGKDHRLLITDLLDHVNPTRVFNLVQWYRLAAHLQPLVQVFPEEAK